MPRKSKRRTVARLVKPVKYSSETQSIHIIIPPTGDGSAGAAVMVSDIVTALGVRKFKNFTLRLSAAMPELPADSSNFGIPYYWGLVFIPQGTQPGALEAPATLAATSIYEPNQNVIMAGVHSGGMSQTFKTRLARNLNSSDSLGVLVKKIGSWTGNMHVYATINFAVCY